MRSVFRNLSLTALVAAAAGLSVVGCSSKESNNPESAKAAGNPDVGSVGMQLLVATNAPIANVHYKVTQNGNPVVAEAGIIPEADIPVPGNNRDFVFALTLPVGTGYQIKLTAAWDDPDDADNVADITCESTSNPTFDITAGSDIGVTIPMLCKNVGEGDAHFDVNVSSTACPDLHMGYAVATPRATTTGSPVSVLSSAKHDANAQISYAWTVSPAAAGTFANPNVKDTTFNCTTASGGTPHVLTVKATVGTGADQCSDTLSVPVSCANLLCGNGSIDPGETCDDAGAPGGCPADCTQVCGDGNQEGTTTTSPPHQGEDCDFDGSATPGGTATCTATCTVRVAACGDNFLTPPEVCDPTAPNNTVPCNSNCTAQVAAVCGDGIVSASEACDPLTSATNPTGNSWNCTGPGSLQTPERSCESLATPACDAAEADCRGNGFDCKDAPLNTAAQFTACWDAMDCMRTTNCGSISSEFCLCGYNPNNPSQPLGVGACGSVPVGQTTGPCARQIENAFKATPAAATPSASFMLGHWGDLTLPGPHAIGRLLCDKGAAPVECFH